MKNFKGELRLNKKTIQVLDSKELVDVMGGRKGVTCTENSCKVTSCATNSCKVTSLKFRG